MVQRVQLAALQYIHSLSIVHRDIKSENFVCAVDDPSTIKLIDFDTSKSFSRDQLAARCKYDPFKERPNIVGSLYWESLNSHNGEDLAPSDHRPFPSLRKLALETLPPHGVSITLDGNRPSHSVGFAHAQVYPPGSKQIWRAAYL